MDTLTVNAHDPWSLIPEGAPRDLAVAAVAVFGERGYHATTTRDIAARVGMSSAGLYVHFESKAELLFLIAKVGHQAVASAIDEAVQPHHSPVQRLRSLVAAFTAWHAENHLLAKVAQYELRSLQPADLEVITEMRRTLEQRAATEVANFVPRENVKTATRAIMSLGIDVARWYRSDASPSPAALGASYADLAARMVGCRE